MAATCGWTRGLHEIKHDGGLQARTASAARPTKDSKGMTWTSLLRSVAAIVGLEMHAIIILIVVGLCILVLVIGGPPNDPPWSWYSGPT